MQLMRKYGLPIATSSVTSLIEYFMASDEAEQDTNGDGETEKTPKQEAAEDARETFGQNMDQIFNNLMDDSSKLETVVFIPAGTRITIYPKVDLWLRTDEDVEKEEYEHEGLVNEDFVDEEGGQTSQTSYEAEGSEKEKKKAYKGKGSKKTGGLAGGSKKAKQKPAPANSFAPPAAAGMSTGAAAPPGTFTPPKSSPATNDGVPQLFD
jgi:hypothetical protein